MSKAALPYLMLVDDDPSIGRIFANEIRRMGYRVEVADDFEPARKLFAQAAADLAIIDIRFPGGSGKDLLAEFHRLASDIPIIMLTGHADVELAVECMREGAYDFLTKPCSLNHLELTLQRALEHSNLRQRNRTLSMGYAPLRPAGALIGDSPAMEELRRVIGRVAATEEPVLLDGESGVGKELVASAIWQNSPRRSRPYIAENCCAVSETLLESELFGHEKGAFSGADSRRAGLFEIASGGTLLLDEVGDMPLSMQAKLLRVLQLGEVRRVGGNVAFLVDVRIIAATNKTLEVEAAEGRFREDLLHRINTLTIRVPPLRDRIEDLPALVTHILGQFAQRPGGRSIALDVSAMQRLAEYDWPGNIRELQNVLKRVVVMTAGDSISADDLPPQFQADGSARPANEPAAEASLYVVEKLHIQRVLRQTGGNKSQAARILGITNKTLYNKLGLYDSEES